MKLSKKEFTGAVLALSLIVSEQALALGDVKVDGEALITDKSITNTNQAEGGNVEQIIEGPKTDVNVINDGAKFTGGDQSSVVNIKQAENPSSAIFGGNLSDAMIAACAEKSGWTAGANTFYAGLIGGRNHTDPAGSATGLNNEEAYKLDQSGRVKAVNDAVESGVISESDKPNALKALSCMSGEWAKVQFTGEYTVKLEKTKGENAVKLSEVSTAGQAFLKTVNCDPVGKNADGMSIAQCNDIRVRGMNRFFPQNDQ